MKVKKQRIKNALAKAIRPGQSTFDDMMLPENFDELMAASFAFCDLAMEALQKEHRYPTKLGQLNQKIVMHLKLLTYTLERMEDIDKWMKLSSQASKYTSI